jgi:hypothetical protein
MTWIPDWRITVGTTVYDNVQQVNLTVGRIDIDRQCQAGYARMDIVNTGTTAFDIDVTDALKLEVKDSSGTYVDVFGGEVSDFSISARTPDTTGFLTIGSVLAVGQLAKLPKALWSGSLTQDLDGVQIAAIFASLTSLTTGEVDAGAYEMIARNADPIVMSDIVTLIADSGIGQIYEDKLGRVCFADADHRTVYLATYGFTELDANYAYPSSIKSILQIGKIRNSLSVDYNNNYASNLTDTDATSIATYGLFAKKFESNIKHTADMTDILTRDLALRATPNTQLDSVSFRLDSPDISNTLLDDLLNIFFGQPILLTNLPANILNGEFEGFVEGWTMTASPSRVDLKIYASPVDFSIIPTQWNTVTPDTMIWNDVNATLMWQDANGALV